MAMILEFRSRGESNDVHRSPRRARTDRASKGGPKSDAKPDGLRGEVVLFTGVRYSRYEEVDTADLIEAEEQSIA
jgi:hypothetical protein